jgi:glyoxylase-like metal-dependent hydrolase (beta-lactamase superfamily II)
MLVGERWIPTFPHARYLIGRKEWEHWSADQSRFAKDPIDDSVRPVIDAGLAEFVEPDHKLTGEVWLESTPGHTPGHFSVRIASGDRDAVITGDLMHHPIQFIHPEWNCGADSIPEMARATRRAFIERYGDSDVLVFGTHFATPSAGYIVKHGDAWRLRVEG